KPRCYPLGISSLVAVQQLPRATPSLVHSLCPAGRRSPLHFVGSLVLHLSFRLTLQLAWQGDKAYFISRFANMENYLEIIFLRMPLEGGFKNGLSMKTLRKLPERVGYSSTRISFCSWPTAQRFQ